VTFSLWFAPSRKAAKVLSKSLASLRLDASIVVLLVSSAPAAASSLMPAAEYANVQLSDPAKERDARALMETIRCLVCQGQSIADSDADMAGDMRGLIRQRIEQGEKPEDVRAWLVERYGNWVTYKPPLGGAGAALWLAPIIFLVLGLLLARGRFRRRAR
jgi:cytochrome c-type biogenesis protein CcmH